MSKQISRKAKIFCYAVMNLGGLAGITVSFFQKASPQNILVDFALLIWLNLLFWLLFRMRDKQQM